MASIFISYSRKDKASARRLTEALKGQDLDFWIDWEGIEPTVDWWKEIEKGIEEADNFLFLISPDSARSKVCRLEIEHAVRNGKRLIPMVVRDIESAEAPPQLQPLNWIFFGDESNFAAVFEKLLIVIKTDYEWVQVHRQLQVKALEWERSPRENSFLLRGRELQDAEAQLLVNASKEPYPTQLQREYVRRSREAVDRQRRLVTAISIAVGIVLTGLGIFGWVQAGLATTNAQVAQAESTRALHNANTAEAASILAIDNASTARANAEEALRQARIAWAGELAAEGLLEDEPLRSLLFSVEAFQMLDGPAQRNSLLTGLQVSPSLKTILHGHGASVWGEAISPDSTTLAAGAANGTVTLWDISDPENARQLGPALDSHTPDVWSVAFSPDGDTLAAGTVDRTIVLWDVSDPAAPRQLGEPLPGHTNDVNSVVFSPDGRTLASAGCASPEGLACSQGEIILWDVSDPGKPAPLGEPLPAHTEDVQSLAFNPDGDLLASAAWDNTIILWKVSASKPLEQIGDPLGGHTLPVMKAAFSPDGTKLASASQDGTTLLWDVSRPASPVQLGQPLKGHRGAVWSVAFSPDGRTLVSGGDDYQVILWDVSDPETPVQQDPQLTGHTDAVLSLAFSPDGKTLASGSVDQTVILWDVAGQEAPLQLSQALLAQDFALSMAFSPDSKTLASGNWDTSVRLWDVSDPAVLRLLGKPLLGHRGEVRSVAFRPDGNVLASASCATYDGPACAEGELLLWDISRREAPVLLGGPFVGHADIIQRLVFSPDGQTLVSGSWDGTVLFWDVSDPANAAAVGEPISAYSSTLRSLAISPDSTLLAVGGDDLSIVLWDISEPGNPISLGEMPVKHRNYIQSLVFSPDSRTLASASLDKSVMLWDLSNPKEPERLGEPLRHNDIVFSATFSPDGKMLASASCDRRIDDQTCPLSDISVWDVSDPVAALPLGLSLTTHRYFILALTFSPDGRVLASSGFDGSDGSIILWDIDPRSWAERACRKAGRNFTSSEWARYFPGEEYHATCARLPFPPE